MSCPEELPLRVRRERLILSCQLDRLHLRLAATPKPAERISISIIEKLAKLAPRLPGSVGRWASAIMQGTVLIAGVYDSIF